MLIQTSRFGEIEIDENKVLHFSAGMPGLEDHTRFAALRFDDSYPIFWLQSLEDSGVCMPVIDTFLALPDYAFELEDADAEELNLAGAEELHVVSVLVIPEKIEGMTANLAAPIVINTRTSAAKQIILPGGTYNVRFPIFAQIVRLIKEEDANVGAIKED